MSDDRANRTLLRDRVLDQILLAILDGTLKPGTRLRDDELIEWLGTSRAPIREALTRLTDLGLVEMAPNRYTKVAEVSPRLYADSAAVWAILVTRGLHWGILVFPSEELPLLEALRDELAATDPADFPPGPTVIDRFVDSILVHCTNPVLLETIAVHAPLLQLGVNSYKGFMQSAPIADYFTELIRRCRDHDVDGFEASIRAFLGGPMTAFLDALTNHYHATTYRSRADAGPLS